MKIFAQIFQKLKNLKDLKLDLGGNFLQQNLKNTSNLFDAISQNLENLEKLDLGLG